MNAFLDGMLSVFSLDGLYNSRRFVPKNTEISERHKQFLKRMQETTFEERVIEDIRADFNAFANDFNLAIEQVESETNTK